MLLVIKHQFCTDFILFYIYCVFYNKKGKERKYALLDLFHPHLASKREQWGTYVLFYNSSYSRPHFQ